MTPVIVILFIFALCTSYVYIAMNASTITYVGDYKFIMFKLMITVSIIAMGYLSTWFSSCYANLPYVGGPVASGLKQLFEQEGTDGKPQNTIVRTFLEYLSGVWFVFAIALLPFGHTVYQTNSENIDMDKTNQLKMIYQAVYSGPYYFMSIVFSFHLFLVFFAIANCNHKLQENNEEKDMKDTIKESFSALARHTHSIVPTCGWFFYIENYNPKSYEE